MQKLFKIHPPLKRRFKFVFYFLLFTFYCLLFGCAMTSDVVMLRNDMSALRKDNTEIKKDLSNLKEKTAYAVKEDSLNAIRENQTEMHSRLLVISKDLQVLTGRFDENKYSSEKALKSSASEIDLLKAQITAIEGQIKDIRDRLNIAESPKQQKEPLKEQPKRIEKKGQEPKKEKQQQAEVTDKTKAYEAAYNAFKNKKYKESREKFETFIKKFPKDDRTDNAQFWIGETYYNEKDFEGAILAYETLLKKYTKSEKVPGALLKQGFSFIEIGDRKTGKTILEKLRERYPDAKEAALAKKKIEELDKKTTKKKK
ncbi:MAG: tol-pal system protein YbgF [Nitrospirota bacterium]|nr:tol-pal system protein YbgF [Nitrospirota bacterium]